VPRDRDSHKIVIPGITQAASRPDGTACATNTDCALGFCNIATRLCTGDDEVAWKRAGDDGASREEARPRQQAGAASPLTRPPYSLPVLIAPLSNQFPRGVEANLAAQQAHPGDDGTPSPAMRRRRSPVQEWTRCDQCPTPSRRPDERTKVGYIVPASGDEWIDKGAIITGE
jgi:hypothetical protein